MKSVECATEMEALVAMAAVVKSEVESSCGRRIHEIDALVTAMTKDLSPCRLFPLDRCSIATTILNYFKKVYGHVKPLLK